MIRAAGTYDLPKLRELERAAGEVFAELGMDAIAGDEPPTIEALGAYVQARRAWVSVDARNRPIAYLLLDPIDAGAHLEQVSVDPRHARRGIGASLIEAAARWAEVEGFDAVTLITFRDVPWNRPYYERIGFEVLGESELTPGLRALRVREAERGLDRWPRVAMRRPARWSGPAFRPVIGSAIPPSRASAS